MANIVIKSEERRIQENYVLSSYGIKNATPEQREAAQVVAAKSNEAYRDSQQRRKYYV